MDQFVFSHKHYVPIMKTKAGERWALSHLDRTSQAHLTPVLELHDTDKNLSTHADDVCEDLSSDWGTTDPFFLDTIWVHGTAGLPGPLAAVFDAARNYALMAMPVVRVTYDPPTLAQVRAILDEDDRGCMLRVSPSQSGNAALIDSTLRALDLEPGQVHLLLDYQASQMELRQDIPRIPHLADWRTFTAASGGFPRSLANLPSNTWHLIARSDWQGWEPHVSKAGFARRPTFGDYTLRDPGAPPKFGVASVNMRYTCNAEWLVRTGGLVRDGAAPQMKTVCRDLIARSEYSGAAFSAGDREIFQTAQPGTGTGGATQWVQWCVSHHLVFTASQIQQHPAL